MQNALKLLETRRRRARPKTPAVPPSTLQDAAASGGTQSVKGIPSLVGMKEWLQRLGHSVWMVNELYCSTALFLLDLGRGR